MVLNKPIWILRFGPPPRIQGIEGFMMPEPSDVNDQELLDNLEKRLPELMQNMAGLSEKYKSVAKESPA